MSEREHGFARVHVHGSPGRLAVTSLGPWVYLSARTGVGSRAAQRRLTAQEARHIVDALILGNATRIPVGGDTVVELAPGRAVRIAGALQQAADAARSRSSIANRQ